VVWTGGVREPSIVPGIWSGKVKREGDESLCQNVAVCLYMGKSPVSLVIRGNVKKRDEIALYQKSKKTARSKKH